MRRVTRESGPTVAVVGSANLDVVVPVPHHPMTGETVLGGDHALVPGGKGANQAVAAARMGATVTFVGRIGDDDAGVTLRSSLGDAGVDTSCMVIDTGVPSGIALISVDDDGDNAIVVSPGANSRVSADDVVEAGDAVSCANVLLLQLEVPLDVVATAAHLADGVVVLNPAPAPAGWLPDGILDHVDVLVPNAIELAQLTGNELTDDPEVLVALARRLGVATVVVTRGGDGALVVTADNHIEVPTPAVDVVDTTGAGDAFCGALASALARGHQMDDAVHVAVHAGALAATRAGAQPSMPGAAEVAEAMGGWPPLPDDPR
ncbi:MAG: ribokinase [Actinomycetota bacterium]|nr:ribokinase [Actinomycetota bacterium]